VGHVSGSYGRAHAERGSGGYRCPTPPFSDPHAKSFREWAAWMRPRLYLAAAAPEFPIIREHFKKSGVTLIM
jgi:hypothetical protein